MHCDLTLPTLGDTCFKLRHYQQAAVDRAYDYLFTSGGDAGILQLATGTGKTPTVGTLIRKCFEERQVDRVLFLVHRDELAVQACNTLEACGLAVGREQGRFKADALARSQVVVSTVQTMMRRQDQWPRDEFQLVVVDEAHNYGAKRFKEVITSFHSKLLGITATIDRADKKSLDHFGQVIYSYSLWDAINDDAGPFLSPIKFTRISLGADLRECRTIGRKGDFQPGELGKLIQPHVEIFANAIVQEIGHRKTMVFMPCVDSSSAMANALNQLGVTAKWVSGDHKDRKHIVNGYKKGEFQVIVNCNLLGEGFDDPATEVVVIRPTRSRIVYCQQVGRATRLFPGKEFAHVIDFGHTSDLELIGPSSLAELDTAVAKEMDKIIANDKGVSLWDAVERAKEEVKRQREELNLQVSKLKLTYRRVEVTPFQAAKNLGVLQTSDTFSERATVPQSQLLRKLGIPNPEQLTKKQASKMIQASIERRQAGLCTVKQLNLLCSLGVEPFKARKMTFEQASQQIGQLLNA